MKHSLLIIGNSQAGALISASKSLCDEYSVSWFAVPGGLPQLDGSILISHKNTVSNCSSSDCVISNFDTILFSALGSGSPREARWNHPIFEISSRPTSDELLRRLILSHTAAARHLLSEIRSQNTYSKLFCQRWPRPPQKELEERLGFDVKRNWTRFCEAENSVLEEFCQKNGILLLPYPKGNEYFSAPDLLSSNDPFHVGTSYGNEILMSFKNSVQKN